MAKRVPPRSILTQSTIMHQETCYPAGTRCHTEPWAAARCGQPGPVLFTVNNFRSLSSAAQIIMPRVCTGAFIHAPLGVGSLAFLQHAHFPKQHSTCQWFDRYIDELRDDLGHCRAANSSGKYPADATPKPAPKVRPLQHLDLTVVGSYARIPVSAAHWLGHSPARMLCADRRHVCYAALTKGHAQAHAQEDSASAQEIATATSQSTAATARGHLSRRLVERRV
jgi:hypothetical protein